MVLLCFIYLLRPKRLEFLWVGPFIRPSLCRQHLRMGGGYCAISEGLYQLHLCSCGSHLSSRPAPISQDIFRRCGNCRDCSVNWLVVPLVHVSFLHWCVGKESPTPRAGTFASQVSRFLSCTERGRYMWFRLLLRVNNRVWPVSNASRQSRPAVMSFYPRYPLAVHQDMRWFILAWACQILLINLPCSILIDPKRCKENLYVETKWLYVRWDDIHGFARAARFWPFAICLRCCFFSAPNLNKNTTDLSKSICFWKIGEVEIWHLDSLTPFPSINPNQNHKL